MLKAKEILILDDLRAKGHRRISMLSENPSVGVKENNCEVVAKSLASINKKSQGFTVIPLHYSN